MNYNNEILYPPRPKNPVHHRHLHSYDNNTYLAQPKLNGDCVVIYLIDDTIKIKDRHKQSFRKSTDELKEICTQLKSIAPNNSVLVGEWMIKSKKNANNELFNKKLVLHDIIVQNNAHLSNYTFQERYEILKGMLEPEGIESYDPYIFSTGLKDIYLVKSFEHDFKAIYNSLVEIDMYEGLVLKVKNKKLELGFKRDNNSKSMIKFRKPTPNSLY